MAGVCPHIDFRYGEGDNDAFVKKRWQQRSGGFPQDPPENRVGLLSLSLSLSQFSWFSVKWQFLKDSYFWRYTIFFTYERRNNWTWSEQRGQFWLRWNVCLSTLLGTNISPEKSILKMIFLFPRWDMLISWRVTCFYRSKMNDSEDECSWWVSKDLSSATEWLKHPASWTELGGLCVCVWWIFPFCKGVSLSKKHEQILLYIVSFEKNNLGYSNAWHTTTAFPSSSHLGKRFRSFDFKAGSLEWTHVNMNAMCQIWYVKSTCFQYKIHLPCFSSMICMLFDLFTDVEIYGFSIVGLQASTQHW